MEKICLQISRRVNGRHLPFIGYGRTGAESHTFRQKQPYPNSKDTVVFNYFCYKGVAGIVIPTQVVEQRRSLHWKTLKRNKGT